MKKIVLFQLNQLGYGGTEKAIFTFLKNLDSQKYIPKIFFFTDKGKISYYRIKLLSLISKKYKEKFIQKYRINFARYNDFIELVGKENIYLGTKEDFFNLCNSEKIDIIHFNRGISEEFYTKEINRIPKNIRLYETNIFGKESNSEYLGRLSKIFFVSKWLIEQSSWVKKYSKGEVLYNPIVLPKTNENLKSEYQIPSNSIVLGRISRPNLDDGEFIVKVIKKIAKQSIYFFILGASESFKKKYKDNKNVICLEPTTSEIFLSKFYNSIDLLLHYRKEGETFGMNIAEAMIHGKPVISHFSSVDNAQYELLVEEYSSGVVVEENNIKKYIKELESILENKELREKMGENALLKSRKYYSEKVVIEKLESFYENL